MNIVKNLFLVLLVNLSSVSFLVINAAETPEQVAETPSTNVTGYISDELFIYMHSGAGRNYRILGTINSGTEVQLTGNTENEYSEIIDTKNRNAWVESKYVSTDPGLRFVIAELNSKLADNAENNTQITQQLDSANNTVSSLEETKKQHEIELKKLNKLLVETQSQVKDQDTNMKKEWFFNGAIVLVIGLLLGLVIPKLVGKRRSGSMDSWN